jgi:hypothetical protein
MYSIMAAVTKINISVPTKCQGLCNAIVRTAAILFLLLKRFVNKSVSLLNIVKPGVVE